MCPLRELCIAEQGRPTLLYLVLFYNISHNGGTWGDKYFLRWYAVKKRLRG